MYRKENKRTNKIYVIESCTTYSRKKISKKGFKLHETEKTCIYHYCFNFNHKK